MGGKLQLGKLPPELLAELLMDLGAHDPRVLVGPAVGEDCAVVEMGDRLLVAKSDPVTFTGKHVGWYSVQVNANDIACSGAAPTWFLPTVLLPTNMEIEGVREIYADISNACRDLGIMVVGGHSEVTPGIDRPIVAGTMLGELLDRTQIVTTAGAQDGDSVVLTTGLAIEGTAVLATECAGDLQKAGVAPSTIYRAAQYLREPGISVVAAARVLCESIPVHSMHDVTEGGVLTALWELATASNLGVVFEAESAPVLAECEKICGAMGIDPLGLLGSGALLATMSAIDAPRALQALDSVGVNGWEVGQMVEQSGGMWLVDRAGERQLPKYSRDELARYLDQRLGAGVAPGQTGPTAQPPR